MGTCLTLSSGNAPSSAATSRRTSVDGHGNGAGPAAEQHDPREEAASEAALAVALAADEDSLHCLVAELLKALEDVAGRALGAARLLAAYAKATRQDLQPHVDELMTVSGWGMCVWGCRGLHPRRLLVQLGVGLAHASTLRGCSCLAQTSFGREAAIRGRLGLWQADAMFKIASAACCCSVFTNIASFIGAALLTTRFLHCMAGMAGSHGRV
jgi:hypothetical protein